VTVCDEAHLRDTTAAAGDPGVVTFACSGTIAMASTLNVTTTLALDATDQDVTLSGNHAGQVLRVDGGTLTLTHLTVANGGADVGVGSGIYNSGTLTLTASTVSGNTAGRMGADCFGEGVHRLRRQ
jgi:hypothetical protein